MAIAFAILQDFTVFIDGDLLLAVAAAVGAAFFFLIYQAITVGRRRRRKRRSDDKNDPLFDMLDQHKNRSARSTSCCTENKIMNMLLRGKRYR